MPGSIFYTVNGVVRIDINTVLHVCTLGVNINALRVVSVPSFE